MMLNSSINLQEVQILDLPIDLSAEDTATIFTNWSKASYITSVSLTTLALENATFSTDAASEALAILVDAAP